MCTGAVLLYGIPAEPAASPPAASSQPSSASGLFQGLLSLAFLGLLVYGAVSLYHWVRRDSGKPAAATGLSGLPNSNTAAPRLLSPKDYEQLTNSTLQHNPAGVTPSKPTGQALNSSETLHVRNFESLVSADANTASPARFSANGKAVTDRHTGLVWALEDSADLQKLNPSSGKALDSYSQAISFLVVTYNLMKYGGYSDWRVPTVSELATLCGSDQDRTQSRSPFPSPSNVYWTSNLTGSKPAQKPVVIDFLTGKSSLLNPFFLAVGDSHYNWEEYLKNLY